MADVQRCDRTAQTLRHNRGAGQVGLRQDDSELFAAIPRQKIVGPFEDIGQSLSVARRMSQAIVVALKEVDIDHDQRHFPRMA